MRGTAIEKPSATAYIPFEVQEQEGQMPIDLTTTEKELVKSLLDQELEDIRSELHHTQNHEYRDSLKEREQVIREVLAKLSI
jgi:hypothetical protein